MITLARKPLSEPNVALNVLVHGTGGLNIALSRLRTDDNLNGGAYSQKTSARSDAIVYNGRLPNAIGDYKKPTGRWPANTILQHLPGCHCMGLRDIQPMEGHRKNPVSKQSNAEGSETIPEWSCVAGCPIQDLDKGTPPQTGGPSRYFKNLL